ncbi:MAG: two-component sensor histidine kinase, partial [Tabrizicola sp.]
MTESQLSRLLTGLPMPAMLVRNGDRVQDCNAAAVALLGEGMIGRHPAIAVRAPSVLAALAAATPDTPPQETRMTLRREGQEQVFHVTVSALGDGLVL